MWRLVDKWVISPSLFGVLRLHRRWSSHDEGGSDGHRWRHVTAQLPLAPSAGNYRLENRTKCPPAVLFSAPVVQCPTLCDTPGVKTSCNVPHVREIIKADWLSPSPRDFTQPMASPRGSDVTTRHRQLSSDLSTRGVRLAPNGTNLWYFNIRLQYIWARRQIYNENEVWLAPSGSNMCLSQIRFQYISARRAKMYGNWS